MASDDDTDSVVSLVLADLRSLGCELRPDSIKRLRRVLAEDPERRERTRQSMANGGRKGFRARRSAQQGLSHDKLGRWSKIRGAAVRSCRSRMLWGCDS
jgi:hypothetical protein